MSNETPLPLLTNLVNNLGAAIAGRATAELAESSSTFPDEGVVVVLPSWVWILPKIDVGRKGLDRDGTAKPMPVRVAYDGGPVRILAPGEEQKLRGRIVGLGHNEEFSDAVLRMEDNGVHAPKIAGEEMSPEVRHFFSPRLRDRALRAVIKTGEKARWDIISSLEPFIRAKLAAANTAVAAELGEHSNRPLLSVVDEITLDELLSKLLYGEQGSSVISRMVDRAMDPDTFRRVDPMRHFAVAIRARSEEAVRTAIGDPKIGPKVRRIQAMSNAQNLDELLDAYRRIYPSDSLAAKRAIAALTAGPELAAYQREFDDQRATHSVAAPPADLAVSA